MKVDIMLPDDDSVGFGHEHSAVGDVERLVEGVDVEKRRVHPPLAQRVGVYLGETCYLFVADVLRPYGGIGEIETLVCREAVYRLGAVAAQCVLQSRIGHAKTALIGDILTQCELSVGVQAVQNLDTVELFCQNLGLGRECLGILLRPPVGQIAVLVELGGPDRRTRASSHGL